MSTWTTVALTVLIITLSAFFVAVEFSLMAAKRHRLEDAAASSRAARAALRCSSELTLLLAGSQLGITLCTLLLGAITKPAVHHWITPALASWGLPDVSADVIGFILALLIVTFLHLVIGEMAPKSWAIAHPERSATLLALPMRAFMALTSPLLRALNASANWCLRRVGVEPADEVSHGQDPEALRRLVAHSTDVGSLDENHSVQLEKALDLSKLSLSDLIAGNGTMSTVDIAATSGETRGCSRSSGHLRLVVVDGGQPVGMIHVRDVLSRPYGAPIRDAVRPLLILDADTPVYTALTKMRNSATHLVLVPTSGGHTVLTLTDVLVRLFRWQPAA